MKKFLFIFFSFLFNTTIYLKGYIVNIEKDVPIFYYGFTNNEKYQHYMPSKQPNTISDSDLITMTCNKGYTVSVKRATIVDLNNKENDYTQMAQNMCIKKQQCQIDVRKIKRHTHNNSVDFSSVLTLDYICMSSQKNLYDGRSFHQGVTHKYLVLRDQSLACVQNDKDVTKFLSIAKAMEVCDLHNCNYVVWDDVNKKAVICKENNPGVLIEKKYNTTYVNPSHLYINGYATFLNYMSICDNIIKAVNNNLSLSKVIDVCSHLDCHYFTKSFPGTIKSFNKTKNEKTWFCKGFPTIIPMDGFITSVKLSKFV